MKNISDFFGCMVFDDRVMKANLSAEVYNSLRKTIDKGDKTAIIGTSGREDSVFSDKQSELNVKGDKVIDMHSSAISF